MAYFFDRSSHRLFIIPVSKEREYLRFDNDRSVRVQNHGRLANGANDFIRARLCEKRKRGPSWSSLLALDSCFILKLSVQVQIASKSRECPCFSSSPLFLGLFNSLPFIRYYLSRAEMCGRPSSKGCLSSDVSETLTSRFVMPFVNFRPGRAAPFEFIWERDARISCQVDWAESLHYRIRGPQSHSRCRTISIVFVSVSWLGSGSCRMSKPRFIRKSVFTSSTSVLYNAFLWQRPMN
jgi:hypothetical protein